MFQLGKGDFEFSIQRASWYEHCNVLTSCPVDKNSMGFGALASGTTRTVVLATESLHYFDYLDHGRWCWYHIPSWKYTVGTDMSANGFTVDGLVTFWRPRCRLPALRADRWGNLKSAGEALFGGNEPMSTHRCEVYSG